MPACVRIEPRYANWRRPLMYLVVAGLCSTWTAPAIASGFKVTTVQARAGGQTLRLSGSIELSLTQEVEEAIGNGIPIDLVIDIRLYRSRPYIWDQKIASWSLRRELRYHALTGQYLINAGPGAPVVRESSTSLSEALSEMGSLGDLTLPLPAPLVSGAEYYLQLRANLDVEALPPLLRPVAYTSRKWKLDSGWTTWKIQQ